MDPGAVPVDSPPDTLVMLLGDRTDEGKAFDPGTVPVECPPDALVMLPGEIEMYDASGLEAPVVKAEPLTWLP